MVLFVLIKTKNNDKIISENSKAILLNFDGIFPSPEEIMAPYQSFLEQESTIIGWQETTSPVKEVFTPYVKQKK